MKAGLKASHLLLLLLGPLLAQGFLGGCPAWAQIPTPPSGIPYRVEITGAPAEPPETATLLREVSKTVEGSQDLPKSMALLRRRAREDLPEMEKVLRSFGFFRGKTRFRILPGESPPHAGHLAGDTGSAAIPPSPLTVRFEIDPGPRFHLSGLSISLIDGVEASLLPPPVPAASGLQEGSPYSAQKVVEAENRIITHYKTNGYPFPKVEREVTADFATDTVRVSFQVRPGPIAVFGRTSITGLKTLHPTYVQRLIPWQEGQPYDVRLIDKARKILFDSSLFGMVDVDTPREVDEEGRLPITIRVTERAPRTIRLGLEYTTDYGGGLSGSWTHRNLFGMAERVSAGAVFNSRTRTAFGQFRKPMFLEKDNTFSADGAFNDETTDAYDARSVDASAMLNRQVTPEFSAGLGMGFRYGSVEQKSDHQKTTYRLAYLPLTATQDTRTDLLNPTRGYEVSLIMAPYQDVNDEIRFFRYLWSGSTYHDFGNSGKTVFAVRAAFGQIFGITRQETPADLRFYAGGGGSVRGYAYQLAGPIQGTVPLGGLSLLTFSLELRVRITDSIGIVPFLDGGTAFSDRVPDLDRDRLLYGAGLGFRYHTTIGPLRLDVAVPLNRRQGVDDSFQIYVSIGQAF